MLEQIKRGIATLPFVGHALVSSPGQAHRDAFVEIAVGTVLSSMPIWLGAFITTMTAGLPADAAGESFVDVLFQKLAREISHGELLLLGCSFLATVLYLALSTRPLQANKPFPGQLSHVMTVVLILVTASGVFFMGRDNDTLGTKWLVNFSWFVYGSALLLWYTACVYNNERTASYEGITRKQDEDFEKRYAAHKGGQDK